MGNEVSDLKETRLFYACKIWDVAEVSDNAPSGAELPKLIYPYLCTLIKSALSKHYQPRS